MAGKRKNCGNDHRFHEHSIGAGLTRKICTGCGELQIGQGRRAVLVQDAWSNNGPAIFNKAS